MDLRPHVESGRVTLDQIDPAEMSPGEFVQRVRNCVEEQNARVIVIDSLNGYLQSMPGEQFLASHLHELLSYLNNRGVLDHRYTGPSGHTRKPDADSGGRKLFGRQHFASPLF